MQWTSGIDTWGLSPSNVETVEASALSRSRFQSDHVDLLHPICIRGATKDWPAFTNWPDQDYMCRTLGHDQFSVHTQPVNEMTWRRRVWPQLFPEALESSHDKVMSYKDFQTLASDNKFVFARAIPGEKSAGFASLANDVTQFSFLGKTPRPHYYSPLRYFLHGRSYTDWHTHPYDETLMCQFGAPKTVTLLPPTHENWNVLVDVAKRVALIGAADAEQHPELKSLKPLQVEVRSGDSLYIPPHWWHAVECVNADNGPGVTLAYCWRSPVHVELNPNFPYKQFMRKHGTLVRKARLTAENVGWAGIKLAGRAPVHTW